MKTYQPTSPVELPVHHRTPGATVYRWEQPRGADKFLVVSFNGAEVWCSPEAWAIQRAEAVKLPDIPRAVQLALAFD